MNDAYDEHVHELTNFDLFIFEGNSVALPFGHSMATQFAMLRFELKTKLRCTAFFIRTKDPEDPVKILK